jgi:hypothetical protein
LCSVVSHINTSVLTSTHTLTWLTSGLGLFY